MRREKVFHIYAKDVCLYHSLKEEEFHKVWENLNQMVGLMKTDYVKDDLNFEELPANMGGRKSASSNPIGDDSY